MSSATTVDNRAVLYAVRDAMGRIASLHRAWPGEGAEAIVPGHPEVVAFLAESGDEVFLVSDLALIRVVEDLALLLIEKRVIAITDLPAAAQDKLLRRWSLRSLLAGSGGEADGKPI